TFSIGLILTLRNFEADGQLAFLNVHLDQNTDPSDPATADFGNAAFAVDLVNPVEGATRLTLPQITDSNLGDLFSVDFTAAVDVLFHIQVDFGSDQFPSLGADFHLQWGFS